jgi:hypothetical protein
VPKVSEHWLWTVVSQRCVSEPAGKEERFALVDVVERFSLVRKEKDGKQQHLVF